MRGKIQENAVRKLRRGVVVQEDILLHRKFADGAVAHALFGDVSQPGIHPLFAAAGVVISCPSSRTAPLVVLRSPARHSRQLALPVARHAGQPDDFAGVDLQVDPAQRFGAAVAHGAQVLDRQADRAGFQRLRRQRLHLAPDHHLDQLVAGDVARSGGCRSLAHRAARSPGR